VQLGRTGVWMLGVVVVIAERIERGLDELEALVPDEPVAGVDRVVVEAGATPGSDLGEGSIDAEGGTVGAV